MNMRIELGDSIVNLKPFRREDIPIVAEGFSSLRVHMWTNQLFAQGVENETEWYERTRKSEDSCVWAIVPDGSDVPIGVTGIHNIDRFGSCTTGIVIWDPDWWGKGVATTTHLARTLFAADYLNRSMIRSLVRTKNVASQKALNRLGYSVWGTDPLSVFRQGEWASSCHLIWINPSWINTLFPDGVPSEYSEGIPKATKALELARRVVTFT